MKFGLMSIHNYKKNEKNSNVKQQNLKDYQQNERVRFKSGGHI